MPLIRILNIVGARPQIIKASAITRAVRRYFPGQVEEITIHTGQHFDNEMSEVFYNELEIHPPDYNLGIVTAGHGKQTALMIAAIEELLPQVKPGCVLLYGDTNSTLAGAVAASKLHFPIIHIEAGLRSYNKMMPEEINRIFCDHVSTLLFAPTIAAFRNLTKEGFKVKNDPPFTINNPKIYHTGDIMFDNALFYSELAEYQNPGLFELYGLQKGRYVLATIHRESNTDDASRLSMILNSLKDISQENSIHFFIPLHPRTDKLLKSRHAKLYSEISASEYITISPPVSFLQMILLEKYSQMVITDSGGVQKESHFFKKPCIVLRKETEWIELVKNGTTRLAGADTDKLRSDFMHFLNCKDKLRFPGFYGDGRTAEFILNEILKLF